ncbi:MAG: hypothetical protein COY69_01300 [Candidatus Magasanikbacteria bacterium CG_4_10_14_0_8_um_filter_32_14]|uniref:Uncharacterized protein n=1 Tax=Candidatus Magasanikbacteria bacterium CG_4_10_14_0_8_um_filter_32_14 TaxID=1974640 RepID=A0A2M7RAA2_9BACT|nr:MAG: hypothetical protein COY69_01300 [Candidatus Magasanikbacteria bacterium CG_4_10_14_0_8_um_filter_32_14]
MSDTKQPTILVKKADGTKVRVSLAEFKKMRTVERGTLPLGGQMGNGEKEMANFKDQISNQIQMTNVKSNVIEKQEEKPTTENVLMVETPHELATTTPVTDIFRDEVAANFEWDERDNKSLLEEDNAEVNKLKAEGLVYVGGHDLQEHIKMLSMDFDEDLKNRAKSLLISWKKGIRNDHQFLDYATRDANHGGLGLDSEQANRLLQSSKSSKNNLENLFDIVFEKKKKLFNQKEDILKENKYILPKDLFKEEEKPKLIIPEEKKSNNKLITNFSKPFLHSAPNYVVYDVTPPEQFENKTVGPRQEAASFSLIDYRRLSRDPKKSADMLLSKFVGWKEDSFLLFLDTLNGWQESPLYQMYVGTTVEAINNKMTIAQVLETKDINFFLTLGEYESLIEVNSKLNN